ncbi:MAG: hypothetical protein FWD71_07470 [Oscillospiraceae bacterium]|nr:hypothetical protein [Oscillospiraceae bacterium]
MKNFNFSLFLGCCVISIGIIIAGIIVGNHLPPVISGNFSGSIADGTQQFDEYLTAYDVERFLKITDDDLNTLIQSGELKGTYTIIQGHNVFSRDKLSEWIKTRIDNE